MDDLFASRCVTNVTEEGVNVFLEKYPPVWQEK